MKISIGVLGTIILAVLKLDGVLQWKWILVFSPLWIDLALGLVLLVVILIANREPKKKYKPNIAGGNRLVWDAETQTMYGDCEKELTIE